MTSPTSGSAALIDATAAICARVSTGRATRLIVHDGLHRLLDPALDLHRVGAGGDVPKAVADHRMGEDDGGRRAVTGDVVGLGGDFLDELRAHVLEWVLELDIAGDRHPVVGDGGRPGTSCPGRRSDPWGRASPDRVGQAVDAAPEPRRAMSSKISCLAMVCGFPSESAGC